LGLGKLQSGNHIFICAQTKTMKRVTHIHSLSNPKPTRLENNGAVQSNHAHVGIVVVQYFSASQLRMPTFALDLCEAGLVLWLGSV
jgi:hypothetical protein